MRIAALLALLGPLFLFPTLARADDGADARKTFAAGDRAYHEARYKEAIDLFLKANELEPHAELIFNVGQAYEKLGDVPDALRSYRDYLRKAPGAGDRATVETSIKNLEGRLREKGIQQVSVFSTPAGAEITLDQKAVGRTPWTGEIAPGRHLVVLKASGFPDTAKEFALTGDRAMDLDISLAAIGSGATTVTPTLGLAAPEPVHAATTIPTEPRKAVEKPSASGGVKPWTLAVLGVGVAGLGTSLGLELARKSADTAARNEPTQLGYADKYATMTGLQGAARALVAVGAAATAVGGVMLIVDLRSNSSARRAVGLGCLGTTCGAFASGSFQ